MIRPSCTRAQVVLGMDRSQVLPESVFRPPPTDLKSHIHKHKNSKCQPLWDNRIHNNK